jgi:hypothetical protein
MERKLSSTCNYAGYVNVTAKMKDMEDIIKKIISVVLKKVDHLEAKY